MKRKVDLIMLKEQLENIKKQIVIPTPEQMLVVNVCDVISRNPDSLETFLRLKKAELLVALEDVQRYGMDVKSQAVIYVNEQLRMLDTICVWGLIDGYNWNMDITSYEMNIARQTPMFKNK